MFIRLIELLLQVSEKFYISSAEPLEQQFNQGKAPPREESPYDESKICWASVHPGVKIYSYKGKSVPRKKTSKKALT